MPGLEVGQPAARVQRTADDDRREHNRRRPRQPRGPAAHQYACVHLRTRPCFGISFTVWVTMSLMTRWASFGLVDSVTAAHSSLFCGTLKISVSTTATCSTRVIPGS